MFFRKKNYQKRNKINFPKNKIFSYRSAERSFKSNSKSSNPNSTKTHRRNNSVFSRFLNTVIILAVVTSIGYIFYLNTDPIIKIEQEVTPRNKADYYNAVRDELDSSLTYKNKLTFSSDKFRDHIKAEFPEIDNVMIEIPVLRHRPTIHLLVSEPSARLVTTDKNYIVDRQGIALFAEEEINDQYDTKDLVSINDSSGHPVVLGEPVLTERQISYIREIIDQSNAANTHAQTFTLEFGGSAVEVKYKDTSYIVKFSFYEDPRQSSGAYLAVREGIESGNVPLPKQYIDLRIPDRAYIK